MSRAPNPEHSVRYAWYVAGLLTLVQIVSYLDRFLPSLLVQPIKHALNLSDFQIGLLLGPAFIIFYVTLGLPLGWLADRINRRAILAVGIAIWCTMTAAGAVANSFLTLFLTRLGVGVGEACVAPVSISLISDYFTRERRAQAISLFMAGAFLGAGSTFLFFGPLVHYIQSLPAVTLPLLGQLQSWRLCFLIVGAPGLLLTLLMLTVREPRRQERVAIGTASNPDSNPSFADGVAYITRRWRAFGTLFITSPWARLRCGTLRSSSVLGTGTWPRSGSRSGSSCLPQVLLALSSECSSPDARRRPAGSMRRCGHCSSGF
jgi:MFS family permease